MVVWSPIAAKRLFELDVRTWLHTTLESYLHELVFEFERLGVYWMRRVSDCWADVQGIMALVVGRLEDSQSVYSLLNFNHGWTSMETRLVDQRIVYQNLPTTRARSEPNGSARFKIQVVRFGSVRISKGMVRFG